MFRSMKRFLLAAMVLCVPCCSVLIAGQTSDPASAAPAGSTIGESRSKAAIPKASPAKKPEGTQFGDWNVSVVNTLRFESWDTFLPAASTLDNTYNYSADRLALTLKYSNSWTTFTATVDGVKFFGLPKTGSAGLGPTYYAQNGLNSDYSKAFLRTLNFQFKRIGDSGLSGTIGRFDYSNGLEFKGDNKKIETVKATRIGERVLGPFGFSYYQRSMNGVALNRDNGRFHLGATAWCPTAGGFSKQAGDMMQDIKVVTLAGTFKYDKFIRNQELQLFFYSYDDNRPVVGARGDNSVNASGAARVSTGGVDVNMKNFGISMVGAYDHPDHVVDTMLWVVSQRGHWYELAHRASAFAVEAGYQWKKAPWAPWLRIGLNQSSGDDNPTDGDHTTFFQMLPTARQYSWSTAYNLMNSRDAFLQIILKPNPKLSVRADYHQLRLTESADRWYSGAGATAESGAATGFAGRASGGSDDLGKVMEIQGTYTFNKSHSATLYLSKFIGGAVSQNAFPGEKDQSFSFLELTSKF